MTIVPLQEDLLYLIHDTARLIGLHFDRLARRHGMSRAQWVLLVQLDRQPGLSQRDLAEALEVEPITVGRLVDKLEARGLVERQPDEQDRRIWRLHLLPPAKPFLVEIGQQRAKVATLVSAGLTPDAREQLRQGLLRSKANVTAALRRGGAEDGNATPVLTSAVAAAAVDQA